MRPTAPWQGCSCWRHLRKAARRARPARGAPHGAEAHDHQRPDGGLGGGSRVVEDADQVRGDDQCFILRVTRGIIYVESCIPNRVRLRRVLVSLPHVIYVVVDYFEHRCYSTCLVYLNYTVAIICCRPPLEYIIAKIAFAFCVIYVVINVIDGVFGKIRFAIGVEPGVYDLKFQLDVTRFFYRRGALQHVDRVVLLKILDLDIGARRFAWRQENPGRSQGNPNADGAV